MRRYVGWLVVLVFWAGLTTCSLEKEPVKEKTRLEWKWEKGKTCRYKLTQEMEQKMETPQGDMETSLNQMMVYSEKVTELDDKGVATKEVKYESIKIEMNNPVMGKITFDSTKEEDMKKAKDNPALRPYAVMLGKAFTVKITTEGKVVEVKGVSKLMEEILQDLEDEDLEDNTITEQLKKTFSDEAMKNVVQQSYAQLPKEEVAIGDSWETSQEMSLPPLITVKSKNQNTYKGKETLGSRDCARIDSQMDLTISIKPDHPFNQMFDIEWERVPATIVWLFDPKDGIIIRQESKMNMKVTFTSKRGEGKMKMEMKTTVKTELVE